ncbi:3-deoxy-8-phosphooctulonate synthase [Candidatus Bandiella numerosa]|jgi:2-dehydro-3-deoxyphosphooctonate aldolase (KDO 8-P synthase)|uniref:3-deoxy-8-phosphooctulonate synthase n=1 Tax=Candidatus Bandiella numerosa TaxID=2570586 RepID=UPI00249EC859|nr:3-deoxy-8-phosphooctulonate synthase [Candidatus Bandiella numerosa]WHA04365.1 3-deoxy-8-phosphooctulonate synthase [Candidatus Bandiella numerosa]
MHNLKQIAVGNIKIANNLPLVLIAGPCQMESKEHALYMAKAIKDIADSHSMSLIFKTSFDKANRTSIGAKRGIGIEASIPIFAQIKEEIGCPILTDVHSPEQCNIIAKVVDILQIPAFLCRQTDLLITAANTGKIINIKKGQFLAPWDVKNIISKIELSGNEQILLTERGVSFGYNTLINDMRGLEIMKETGYPVVFDATHSVQQPGGLGNQSGGQRQFIKPLARAATSIGIAALFIETHDNPDIAPSDGSCMLHIDDLNQLLMEIKEFDNVAKKFAN